MTEIMGFNPIKLTSGIATKNNNTTAYVTTFQNAYIGGFAINRIPPNKKTYFEYKILELKNDAASVGIADFNNILPYSTTYRNFVKSVWQYLKDGTVMNPKQYGSSYGSRYSIGDIIGVKVNLIDYQIEFTKNGVSCGIVPTPLDPTHEYYPYFVDYNVDVNIDLVKIIEKKDEMLYLPEGYEPLVKRPNKYLLKQSSNYYTLKSEFYKNNNYEPITELEGKEVLTQNDFETYGIDDLNLLTETIDTQVVNGVDKGNLGSGKYFKISLYNEFKIIKQNEVAEISKDLTKGQKYYGSREAYSNNIVSNAFDDNYNTIYKPYDSFSAWVTVEFNEPKEIIKYTVNTGDNSPNVSTSLYFSDNNIDFIKVGESEYYGNSPSSFSKTFKSHGFHRYWRVYRGQGSNWVEFKEIEMMGYNYPQMLLIYNSELYTFNNTEIILSPSQILDENNFTNNGFVDATSITEEQWNTTFPDKSNVKLLMWTDDMNKTDVNIETEIIPFRPVDKLQKNSDICNILFKEV